MVVIITINVERAVGGRDRGRRGTLVKSSINNGVLINRCDVIRQRNSGLRFKHNFAEEEHRVIVYCKWTGDRSDSGRGPEESLLFYLRP